MAGQAWPAQLQAAGIEPGDRVAIILPERAGLPRRVLRLLLAGAIVVPMNPLLKSGEIDFFFTDSGAKVAFVWPDFVAEATRGRHRTPAPGSSSAGRWARPRAR